jgi:hypothetical protein
VGKSGPLRDCGFSVGASGEESLDCDPGTRVGSWYVSVLRARPGVAGCAKRPVAVIRQRVQPREKEAAELQESDAAIPT